MAKATEFKFCAQFGCESTNLQNSHPMKYLRNG